MASAGTSLLLAVPAAVAGAASMGLASAAQARATKEVEVSRILDPGLLRGLAHRPLWLIGMVATGAGLALQLVALAYAPLLVVQPLLITSLIFAGAFSARLERRSLDGVMVVGSLICIAGLSVFLMLARPSGNADDFAEGTKPLPLVIVLGLLALIALVVSTLSHGSARVLGLAVATGVLYGVTAGLMKIVAGQARSGLGEPFQSWTLYVVCVVGPMGFLLSQNTFQQGRFLTPALAVITALDPLVGVAIGVWWMGETANTAPLALAGEGMAGALIIVGIVLLSSRASHLARAQSTSDELLDGNASERAV
ncbi:DMT family transporter [Amycolatopsis sp. K13G38]|uniref:DMT family transporter n=1 Tax=Amycolatopsis acididurans TaxID=2724524 RepID=A0ABX1IXE9_9PSEU|nr:DMT family transporter [Amycolatopsis acididurans]NKQ52178.1 DMT family transporter [Amycolatopsis acididurans]